MKQIFASLSLLAFLASCQQSAITPEEQPLPEIFTISGTYTNLEDVASFLECDSAKMVFLGGPLADTLAQQYLNQFSAGTEVALSVSGYLDTTETFIITEIHQLGQKKLCKSVVLPHTIYFAKRQLAGQGEVETSLLLKENGKAVMVTDFLDAEEALIERGNWSVLANQKIEICITEDAGLEVGTLVFSLREDSLIFLGDDFTNEAFSLLAYSQPYADTTLSAVIMAIEAIRLEFGLPLFLYFSENTTLKEVFTKPEEYAQLEAWLDAQGCITNRKKSVFTRVADVATYLKTCKPNY